MAVNVGGVMVEFDGDASGAAAAMKSVSEKLDDLTRKEKELKEALDAATKAGLSAEGGLNALRRSHADAAKALEKMRGSAAGVNETLPHVSTHASSASQKMSLLRNAGQAVDNAMGPLQTTLGGVGQALGTSTGMVQGLVGGMADLGMIVEKMGWWGAALAAVGVAAAAVAEHFSTLEQEATKAAEESARELADLRDELQTINDELDALRTGGSVEVIVKQRRLAEETAKAQEMGEAFKSKYGDVSGDIENIRSLASGSRDLWVQVWDESSSEMKKVRVAASDIVADWEKAWEQGQKVSTIAAQIRGIEEKSKQEAAKAAMDRLTKRREAEEKQAAESAAESQITEQNNALIRALDANTAALELDEELGADAYTAEQRAAREERGVFEVSMEEFDAGLAGIDPGEAARITEEAVAEIFDPFHKATETIISTIDSMSAEDIEKMNSDFLSAGEAALDLRDGFEKFKESLTSNIDLAANQLSDTAWSMFSSGDMNAGAIAGGVAGAVGTALGGPVAGKIAGEIGSKVGDTLESVVAGFMDLIGDDRFSSAVSESVNATIAVSLAPAFLSFAMPGVLPLAGLAAFTFALSKSTESFARFQGAMSVVVDKMVSSLEPLWESMLWMVGLFDLFSSVMAPLFDMIISGMDNILGETLFNVFKTLLVLFAQMAYSVANTTNFLWELAAVTAQLTGADDERVAKIRENKVNMTELNAAIRAAKDITYEQAQAIGEANAATYDATELEREQNTSLSLTNVPSGYKALGGIYAVADAEMRGAETMSSPINVIIQNWWSNRAIDKDFEEIRNIARNGNKSKKGVSRRYGGDKN